MAGTISEIGPGPSASRAMLGGRSVVNEWKAMTGPTDRPQPDYSPPRAPLWGLPDPAPHGSGTVPGSGTTPGPERAVPESDPPAPPTSAVLQPAPGARPHSGMDRRVLLGIAAIVLVALSTVIVIAVRAGSERDSPTAAPPVGYTIPTPDGAADPTDDTTYPTDDASAADDTDYSTEDPISDAPTPTGSAEAVPDGYRIVSGPAGVRVPVPEAWSLGPAAVPSNLQADDPAEPGRFLRFGGDPADGSDPVATVGRYEADSPSIRTGYHRIRLEPVAFGPSSLGADWEFTFLRDGQMRHAYGRYWHDAGTLYVVYLSTYEADWSSSAELLQVVLNYSGPA
jgi:hypothetical protein